MKHYNYTITTIQYLNTDHQGDMQNTLSQMYNSITYTAQL